ncbi:MAG TPA: CbiX/SirB N-terminal domain-containing protein [Vicinamibacterales bacterium]|nr:CbiX/SirB N-terminal domain-containing protein [Vicinamibacterales bacterium]
MRIVRSLAFATLAVVTVASGASGESRRGVLLLAHGGNEHWNAQVEQLAAKVDQVAPTEVAFGMATRANIQAAVDRLHERGVSEIVAVPLFVSSWSSVITATEYLLGQRAEAPPQLAMFAKMNHGGHNHGHGHGHHPPAGTNGHDAHATHASREETPDPLSPVVSKLPIRMTPALNDHPVVSEILLSRARSISEDPIREAVVIVAHGPVGEEENRRWLADMESIAARMRKAHPFASIDCLTLRDDAPKPIRDAATAELRQLVSKRIEEDRRVLIVPLLVSFGGIERGLRERLEGLPYAMPSAALVPDDRLVAWVLEMAGTP